MKIASMKNANASSANGSPITDPHRPINPGQNSPSAKDRTVPDTAPIATRMPSARAQRRVIAIHTASSLRIARNSVNSRSSGTPIGERREHDVEAESDGHLRPGRLQRRQCKPDAITSSVENCIVSRPRRNSGVTRWRRSPVRVRRLVPLHRCRRRPGACDLRRRRRHRAVGSATARPTRSGCPPRSSRPSAPSTGCP